MEEVLEFSTSSDLSCRGVQVLNLQCTACNKPCRTQTEKDLHTKRTGHNEFQNKACCLSLPVQPKQLILHDLEVLECTSHTADR